MERRHIWKTLGKHGSPWSLSLGGGVRERREQKQEPTGLKDSKSSAVIQGSSYLHNYPSQQASQRSLDMCEYHPVYLQILPNILWRWNLKKDHCKFLTWCSLIYMPLAFWVSILQPRPTGDALYTCLKDGSSTHARLDLFICMLCTLSCVPSHYSVHLPCVNICSWREWWLWTCSNSNSCRQYLPYDTKTMARVHSKQTGKADGY